MKPLQQTTTQVTVSGTPTTADLSLPFIEDSCNRSSCIHKKVLKYTTSDLKTSMLINHVDKVKARHQPNSLHELVSKSRTESLPDFGRLQNYFNRASCLSPSKKLVQFGEKVMMMPDNRCPYNSDASSSKFSCAEGKSETNDDQIDYGYETTCLHDKEYYNLTDTEMEHRRKRRRYARRNSKTPSMLMAMISPILSELHADSNHNPEKASFTYGSFSSSSLSTSLSRISLRDFQSSRTMLDQGQTLDGSNHNWMSYGGSSDFEPSLNDSSSSLQDNTSASDDIEMSLELAEDLVHRLKRRRF